VKRCSWCESDDLYISYHDKEWGTPVHDDNKHFEFLVLESFQAGLSWFTILRKRENFRKAFDGFNPKKVAKYDNKKIENLMKDAGIIRNRRKIEAAINNARRFLEVQKEFGSFDKYIWGFTKFKPKVNSWKRISQIPATTKLSDRISEDLKKRGFKFVGSTVIYAHLQAIGIVNDHIVSCFRYNELIKKIK
jgi:DNA-3-methyladenine glycosylase I